MARFVKVILFLLLAVVLYGMTNNHFTREQVKPIQCNVTYSDKQHGEINAPVTPCLPEAELINMQSHQLSVTRLQRLHISEHLFSLRNLLFSCSNRDNSLSQQLCKIYNTTTSYFCQPSSEYYVFALRRIII